MLMFIWMLVQKIIQSNVLHYKMFDFLADAFEKANGKQRKAKKQH